MSDVIWSIYYNIKISLKKLIAITHRCSNAVDGRHTVPRRRPPRMSAQALQRNPASQMASQTAGSPWSRASTRSQPFDGRWRPRRRPARRLAKGTPPRGNPKQGRGGGREDGELEIGVTRAAAAEQSEAAAARRTAPIAYASPRGTNERCRPGRPERKKPLGVERKFLAGTAKTHQNSCL